MIEFGNFLNMHGLESPIGRYELDPNLESFGRPSGRLFAVLIADGDEKLHLVAFEG